MLVRLSKIILGAAIGLYLLIVALNNVTDYKSNYEFVRHVLAMDTTFPGNALMWRAIQSEPIYHLGYASGSRTGSGFGVWGQAVTTARFSVSYSFAPFTRNRAPLPRVLTAALRLR